MTYKSYKLPCFSDFVVLHMHALQFEEFYAINVFCGLKCKHINTEKIFWIGHSPFYHVEGVR